MEKSCRYGAYYFKQDIHRTIRENRTQTIICIFATVFGIAIGIYFGIKTESNNDITGVLPLILRGEYAPFSIIIKHFLHFLLHSAIVYLGTILLSARIFCFFGILFFAKYQAQIIAVFFCTDPLIGAVLTLLLIHLPIIIVGIGALFYLSINIAPYRTPYGGSCVRYSIFRSLRHLFFALLVFFLLLVLIFFVLCGIIRLLVVAI